MRFKIGYTLAAIATVALTPVAASAHNTGYHHTHQRSSGDQQLVGGAIGAVAGAVIGSQVAGNGARTEGSVLGAVIGGVAGAAIAGNGNNTRHYSHGGHYNANTGYYGGYTTRPHTTYRTTTTPYYSNGTHYTNGGYYQPNHTTTYTTTYSQPYYNTYTTRPYYSPYVYTRPRAAININLGHNNRHYRGRSSYRAPLYNNNGRRHNNGRHHNNGRRHR